VNLQKTEGNLHPKQRGKPQLSHLTNAEPFVKALVAEHPDTTNVPRLRDVIRLVLAEDSYKQNALRLQDTIRHAGGVTRAADIIEQAVSTGQPVKADVR
jgi:hypothetical protein